MESKKINQLATELTPALSDLTIIGDPTTGISKKITLSQMASLFTGTVEEYANLAAFPLVGTADTIYIALDTNVLYRWDTTLTSYVELSPNIVTSLVFSDANGFDGNISLVGSVATLTITTALTQGSVAFIGASGALSQDNANYFWDNTNKRLGINTNTPTTAIDAFGSGIIGRLNGTSTNNAFLGFASADTNKWSIGNVQSDHRFRIYSEANTTELVSVLQTGEFGIGIANPLTKLHIFGGASALIANLDANTSVAKSISFRSGNSSRINLEVSGTESGSNAGANFYLRTYTDAGSLLATPLTITRATGAATFSGAVGIGATAGTNGLFEVSNLGTGVTVGDFLIDAANKNVYVGRLSSTSNDNTNFIVRNRIGTELFKVTGNTGAATFSSFVGINGSPATAFPLEAYINSSTAYSSTSRGNVMRVYNTNTGSNIFAGIELGGAGTANDGLAGINAVITGSGSAALTFYTRDSGTFSEKVRISPEGRLGIATSTPSYILDVTPNNSTFAARIRNLNTSTDSAGLIVQGGVNAGNEVALFRNSAGNDRMTIFANGNVVVNALGTGIVYSSSGVLTSTNPSDSRLKENIKTIEWGLNDILKLRPVKYNWKEDKINQGVQFGFIAQEVKEIMPEAIKEFGDEIKYLGLEKDAIYATLIKAIQELNSKIDAK